MRQVNGIFLVAVTLACTESGFGGASGPSGKKKSDAPKANQSQPQEDGNAATTIKVKETASANELADVGNRPIKSYTSEDPEIATVSKDGTITGVKPGKTTITIVFKDGGSSKIVVTVKDGGGADEPLAQGNEVPIDLSEGQDAPPTISDTSGGNAQAVFEDQEAKLRRELFDYGGDSSSSLVDYVFIIDNSVSMNDIQDKTSAGFASLSAKDVFPDRARVAVMSTLAANRNDLSVVHPDVDGYQTIGSEPGFLDFVDKDAIANYKAVAPAGYAGRWPSIGCGKWFEPDEKDAGGTPCMVAHSSMTNHAVGLEAGATAFAQLLEKRGDVASFRNGAIVNLVFVSDTHEPGKNSADILANRPSADSLRQAAEKANTISGFKINALAPESSCTIEDTWDLYYYDLVAQTGGFKKDSCTISNYESVIGELVNQSSAPDKPVFALSKPATKIIAVKIDGVKTDDYKLNANQDAVTIDNLPATKKVKIEVVYHYE